MQLLSALEWLPIKATSDCLYSLLEEWLEKWEGFILFSVLFTRQWKQRSRLKFELTWFLISSRFHSANRISNVRTSGISKPSTITWQTQIFLTSVIWTEHYKAGYVRRPKRAIYRFSNFHDGYTALLGGGVSLVFNHLRNLSYDDTKLLCPVNRFSWRTKITWGAGVNTARLVTGQSGMVPLINYKGQVFATKVDIGCVLTWRTKEDIVCGQT